ncbi:MAG: glycerol-3-phosphate dehydrogenase subunit GlpB [Anaerolineae bacterium]
MSRGTDVLVIGAGLAGLTAGWQAAAAGASVSVIAKGWGATHWHAGCVDVLGYFPLEAREPVDSPGTAAAALAQQQPRHPYVLAGTAEMTAALQAFQTLCEEAGYPLVGSAAQNWLLPSAVGVPRPTCLAPATMSAGDLRRSDPMLIVGFAGLMDFNARLAADNLAAQGQPARAVEVEMDGMKQRRQWNSVMLARLFESPSFRDEFVRRVRPSLGEATRIGVPAVLGLHDAAALHRKLAAALERELFEIPTLPPSVPGMRLHHILVQAIEKQGGRVQGGMDVLGAESANGRINAVYTESAARTLLHRAETFILATGGVLGGGIITDYQGRVREVVFNLPLAAPSNRAGWLQPTFLDSTGHPIFRAGLEVDAAWRPLRGDGAPVYDNLRAVGAALAHFDGLRERSLEGVAVTTGFAAGRRATV